jgi:hypothetical protein
MYLVADALRSADEFGRRNGAVVITVEQGAELLMKRSQLDRASVAQAELRLQVTRQGRVELLPLGHGVWTGVRAVVQSALHGLVDLVLELGGPLDQFLDGARCV